jgi:hypothetical protein
VEKGVSTFTVGASGPDYDLGLLRDWIAWRDDQNKPGVRGALSRQRRGRARSEATSRARWSVPATAGSHAEHERFTYLF